MFNSDVNYALDFLNPDLCKSYNSGATFDVKEKIESGKACIQITTPLPCIHIRDLDKSKYGLLSLQKCADHVILKYSTANVSWDLHIIELKRTISRNKWETTITHQFHGALMNAFALCGILHIPPENIRNIYVHCGYRRNTSQDSLVEQKLPLGESARSMDWLTEPLMFDYLPGQKIINIAIQLDKENGEATFSLPS